MNKSVTKTLMYGAKKIYRDLTPEAKQMLSIKQIYKELKRKYKNTKAMA